MDSLWCVFSIALVVALRFRTSIQVDKEKMKEGTLMQPNLAFRRTCSQWAVELVRWA